jgi:flavin reductase (DIM6/NTAB) family NADH-FMN oxidoreductase RutF
MVDLLGCNPSDFKNACSRFPTGVTITTVLGENGLPFGITVSSFTSVSLSPPIVLVCIDHRSDVLSHIAVGRHFGINVLAEHQQELSVKFSRDCSHRFAGVEWYAGRTGVPLFLGVPATFECRTIQLLAVGDHFIVLGQVLHARSSDCSPLTYLNRCYGKVLDLGMPEATSSSAPTLCD